MSNKMALDALTAALDAMEHMANTLNNMDAVDEDEDAQHDAAFEAVRAAIAALQAEPQPANLADTPTPKPQGGMWTLTAPDGRTYQADSPLRCCGLEQRERVPADVAMARIFRAASEPDDSELLDWLEAHLFERKWSGTIGQPSGWYMAGPYRHTMQHMRGESLRAAIRAAIAQERKA